MGEAGEMDATQRYDGAAGPDALPERYGGEELDDGKFRVYDEENHKAWLEGFGSPLKELR